MKVLLISAICLLGFGAPVMAQDDEDGGGFIENWLEDNLSTAGRDVRVRGFSGALSSHATVEEITIADDDGIWFTMKNAELDWTRTALFSGRLEVNKLTADEIEISRRPLTGGDGASAESSQFALPDLPVSVKIGEIDAAKVRLGETVLGVPVQLHLAASAELDGGAGQATLVVERTDDKQGALTLDAAYDNATRNLTLDLGLTEEAGGLVADMIGLPARDAIALTAKGDGPIDDFAATITLATADQPRLTGQVTLKSTLPPEGSSDGVATVFHADLSGDVSTLFFPAYQTFFGPNVSLVVDGQRLADGGIDVTAFGLDAQALRLKGDFKLNALGWPERLNVTGDLSSTDGTSVLLPIGGTETSVGGLDLTLGYDVNHGDGWALDLTAKDVTRAPLALGSTHVTGAGILVPGGDGKMPRVEGKVTLEASGIESDDAALAAAIGNALTGTFSFSRADETALSIRDLALKGDDYALTGDLVLGRDPGFLRALISGKVDLIADDLSRFAALAGQPLKGAANVTLSGEVALPGGDIDVTVTGGGKDLAIGQQQFDALFAGKSKLDIALKRDELGTRIERFAIAAPAASAEGRASLDAKTSDIAAKFAISDASKLDAKLSGAIDLDATAKRSGEAWSYTLAGQAPGQTSLDLKGTFAIEDGALRKLTGDVVARTDELALYEGLAGRPLGGKATLDAKIAFDPPTGAASIDGTATGNNLSFGLGDLDKLLAGASDARFKLRRDNDGTVFA
ncbi:MAG: hypothetical protein ABI459_06210, partial [Deltaproteobacteria bacterium]